MKKIFNQLVKLFFNTPVTIECNIATFHKNKAIYKVYIDKDGIYRFNWSPDFNTLKELDKDLSEKIENYKIDFKD